MSLHLAVTLVVGALALATAWLPNLLRSVPLSLPLVAIGFGYLASTSLPAPDLARDMQPIEYVLEYVLVVAVMGAGLKIDRPFRPRAWGTTWRLLFVAMPISIAGIALVAHAVLPISPAVALLVGAILSPTDPVLASEVQAGPPGAGEDGEVRFALTSEAGLNDGLAMPFVVLAVALLGTDGLDAAGLARWFAVDFVWALLAGAALGAACGWGLVALNRHLPERLRLSASHDGLGVLGVSLLVYGLASVLDVNGLVAVFATAVAVRNVSTQVDYARELHTFGDQVERLVMVLVMAGFGALLRTILPEAATLPVVAVGALTLALVRPASVALAAIGSPTPAIVRAALGYFGIRGLGSFFYLAYAVNRTALPEAGLLAAIVAVTVLGSAVLYGISSGSLMAYLDDHRKARQPLYRGPTLGADDA